MQRQRPAVGVSLAAHLGPESCSLYVRLTARMPKVVMLVSGRGRK